MKMKMKRVTKTKMLILTNNKRKNKRRAGRNSLRYDPTRTSSLRARFIAEMVRRFRTVAHEVKSLLVDSDVFGLKARDRGSMRLSTLGSQRPFTILFERAVANVDPSAWAFVSDAKKLEEFKSWLQQRIDEGILTVNGKGDPWTSPYVDSAYKKGIERAYVDVNRGLGAASFEVPEFYQGAKEQFLRSAFFAPETMSKIQFIYTRTYGELKGVTDAMSQQLSRSLAEGLANGQGPMTIARKMQKDIRGLTNRRAKAIARTEVIRAHAEGQLDAFERLGVKELGVIVEWSTAGDERVCPDCEPLDNRTYTLDEARGMVPLHPNCRCTWVPIDRKTAERQARRGGILESLPDKNFEKLKSGTKWAEKAKEKGHQLDDPALPPWAQGSGALNPIFSSKGAALKSLSKFKDDILLKSSFRGSIDYSKVDSVLSKVHEIPISKLTHSLQEDVYTGTLRKYIKVGDPSKFKSIEVVYRNGQYMIRDGHHRAEAARALGHEFIKAKVWVKKGTVESDVLKVVSKPTEGLEKLTARFSVQGDIRKVIFSEIDAGDIKSVGAVYEKYGKMKSTNYFMWDKGKASALQKLIDPQSAMTKFKIPRSSFDLLQDMKAGRKQVEFVKIGKNYISPELRAVGMKQKNMNALGKYLADLYKQVGMNVVTPGKGVPGVAPATKIVEKVAKATKAIKKSVPRASVEESSKAASVEGWFKELSKAEQEAIRMWTGKKHEQMRYVMEKVTTAKDLSSLKLLKSEKKILAAIQDIQSAIRKAPAVKGPIFRGYRCGSPWSKDDVDYARYHNLLNNVLKKNKVFSFDSFQSFSTSEEIAEKFSHVSSYGIEVMFRFKNAPKYAADVANWSIHKAEQEVLVSPGQKFKVIKCRKIVVDREHEVFRYVVDLEEVL